MTDRDLGRPEYVYGPFHSRRLGLSLGINLLGEEKRCTFNCVYCEIGRCRPGELVPISFKVNLNDSMEGFDSDIRPPLTNLPEIDSATFGYNGETTLAAKLVHYLAVAKKIVSSLPRADGGPAISIFTNSTTLDDPAIRAVLAGFDLVMAKLDCATQQCFEKVNRPHPSVSPVATVIENIKLLRDEMAETHPGHKLAIQTLLFRSSTPLIPSNIDNANLSALADAYNHVSPEIVQVYTIARTPAERGVYALNPSDKDHVFNFLRKRVDTSIEIKVY